jgi:hypothetical protein
MGIPLAFLSFGEANTSFKFIGVFTVEVPGRALEDASGEMQIMLEIPFCARLAPSPLGVKLSLPRGRLATSEKKNDVLTVGVLGVRGAPTAWGVFKMEP